MCAKRRARKDEDKQQRRQAILDMAWTLFLAILGIQNLAHPAPVVQDVIVMDLGEPDAPQRLYDQIKAAGREIEVLVNNAGFGAFGTVLEIPWERTRDMLQLNMLTLVNLTRLFVRDMVARDSGYILQIASTAAYQPVPTLASYAATKSFVLSFGEALNHELRGTNVSCTVLSPGATRTEFHDVAGHKNWFIRATYMNRERVAEIGIRAMLKRRSSLVVGWLNALMAWSVRLTPRRVAVSLAERLMV